MNIRKNLVIIALMAATTSRSMQEFSGKIDARYNRTLDHHATKIALLALELINIRVERLLDELHKEFDGDAQKIESALKKRIKKEKKLKNLKSLDPRQALLDELAKWHDGELEKRSN